MKPKLKCLYDGENCLLQIYNTSAHLKGVLGGLLADPFMLGFGEKPVENGMLVKIRACEMLLIQEHFLES
jgi:hypothetical protein